MKFVRYTYPNVEVEGYIYHTDCIYEIDKDFCGDIAPLDETGCVPSRNFGYEFVWA